MRGIRFAVSLSILVVGLFQNTTIRAQATTTVERFVEPFTLDDVNPCTGEPVVVAGELKITIRTTIDNQGTTHIAYNLVPSHVRGESASGTAYKAVGGEREHTNVTATDSSLTDTFTSAFNLISAGGEDNFLVHITDHITTTADGTTRSLVVLDRSECHG
jgi:hypothetical protein